MHFATAVVALAVTAPVAFAQTSTDCNPTKKSCPNDPGLSAGSFDSDFATGTRADKAPWRGADHTVLHYSSDGAEFTIRNKNDAPTISTDFYVFGARVDVTMRAAPGQGIVSSIVLESDDLDEIDWEFLGGNKHQVQSNFFGKGNTSSYDRAQTHPVPDCQDTFHMYSISWNHAQIEFMIDGAIIRTVPYDSGSTVSGQNYPQTPMRLKLGSWAGGASTNQGTVGWAGGQTDFSQAPFTMYVKSVDITNFEPACAYQYSDRSGSWDSITLVQDGESCSTTGSSSSGSSSGSGSGSSGAKHGSSSSSSAKGSKSPSKSSNADTTSAPVVEPISEQTKGFTSLAPAPVTSTAAPPGGSGQPGAGGHGNGTKSGSGNGPNSSTEASTGSAVLNSARAAGCLLSLALAVLML